MNRVLTLAIGAFVAMILLSACTTEVTAVRLQFSLSESGTLGYEVSDEGDITIEGRNMRFRNAAGAYGVTITEYRIAYFDGAGAAINIGGSAQTGSVNLFVPAGILCPDPDDPKEVYGCSLGDPTWYFGPGPEVVTPQSYQLMPASIALAHVAAGFPIGWYAEIEFEGVDAVGAAFTTAPYFLAITAPD